MFKKFKKSVDNSKNFAIYVYINPLMVESLTTERKKDERFFKKEQGFYKRLLRRVFRRYVWAVVHFCY